MYKDKRGNLQWAWQDINTPWSRGGASPWVFRFYAAVAHGHKSKLYFVPPTPIPETKHRTCKQPDTAERYVEMLTHLRKQFEAWLPTPHTYKMVQDNAKQHTARVTQVFINDTNLHLVEDWPPQSWDLNIIENVWGVLNNCLKGAKSTTSDGWLAAIEDAWASIDITTINALVEGMGERMQAVMDADGQWVPHH